MNAARKQKGVAAVELGFLLVPLVVLAFGTTEFGRAIYQYNILAKATRDAARYLSGQGPGDPTDITTAECLTVYGNRGCTGTALLPGLKVSMVSVCDRISCASTHQNKETGSGVINLVTVTVRDYPFTSLVPAPTLVPDFKFGAIATTMRQVL